MGKGEGSGEGWGEGEGKGQGCGKGNGGTWKGDLCSSCDCGFKCKKLHKSIWYLKLRKTIFQNWIRFATFNISIYHSLGFLGCCLPPLGNFFIAEKTGNDGFEKFIGFLDFCGGAGLCSAIGSMILRGKIRERDGIEGGAGGDCCTSFCCLPCVQCQMANHVGVDE